MENGVIFQSMTREDLRNDIKEILSEVLNEKKGDKFLSRKEVREKLVVSYPTLDRSIAKGELTGYRIGHRILMKESEIALSRFVKVKK
jgi:excisionase family DNA binding protein